MKVLLVVASHPEAEAFRDLPGRVVVSGVGAVSAALATQRAILDERPDLVVSAGIGGAYPDSGLNPGDVALASRMVYARLGAQDGPHFLDLAALGLELAPGLTNALPAWSGAAAWAAEVGAAHGPCLTVETVTGSREEAAKLQARYPGALTEGMEGAGVAQAAWTLGLPAAELRGVSNPVGPRDRAGWQIGPALGACRSALRALF